MRLCLATLLGAVASARSLGAARSARTQPHAANIPALHLEPTASVLPRLDRRLAQEATQAKPAEEAPVADSSIHALELARIFAVAGVDICQPSCAVAQVESVLKRYDWPLGKGDGYLSVDEFEELFFALPAAEKEKLISLAFGDQALTLTELSDAELAAGMEASHLSSKKANSTKRSSSAPEADVNGTSSSNKGSSHSHGAADLKHQSGGRRSRGSSSRGFGGSRSYRRGRYDDDRNGNGAASILVPMMQMLPKLIDAANASPEERSAAAATRTGRGPYPGRLADRIQKERGYTSRGYSRDRAPAAPMRQPAPRQRSNEGGREYYNSQGEPYPGHYDSGAAPPYHSEQRVYYQPNQANQPHIVCYQNGSCEEVPQAPSYRPSGGGGGGGGGASGYRYDYLERSEQIEAVMATRVMPQRDESFGADADAGRNAGRNTRGRRRGGGLSSMIIGGVAAGASAGALLLLLSALCWWRRHGGANKHPGICGLLGSITSARFRIERTRAVGLRHRSHERGPGSVNSSLHSSNHSVVTSASCSPRSASADPESATFALPPPAIQSRSITSGSISL